MVQVLQHRLAGTEDLLDVTSRYAFDQLSPRARRHLPLRLVASRVLVPTIVGFLTADDPKQEA